ncbi:MAG: hypothetical protein PXZ08_02370 [Actinomycetota bacterium]|nr:hypothetical protein [Actinomycetota bacterium]
MRKRVHLRGRSSRLWAAPRFLGRATRVLVLVLVVASSSSPRRRLVVIGSALAR